MNEDRHATRLAGALALLGALGTPAASAAETRAEREHFPHVAALFIENYGQLASQIAFSASTPSGTVGVGRDGVLTYHCAQGTLTETFVAGVPSPTAGRRVPVSVSLFLGNDPRLWRGSVPAFEEVHLGEVWAGIRVRLRASSAGVEKIFSLEPGASVRRIRLRLEGARPVTIATDGSLLVATDKGRARMTAPSAYQEDHGAHHAVRAEYVIHRSQYGFRLGRYDPALPVVIDPLLQATFVGGSGSDFVNAIAVHPSSGEVLVAGTTFSLGLVGIAEAGGSSGGADGFLARFDATLTRLLQITYFGGSEGDSLLGLAIHPTSGDVYVAGVTNSADLPGTIAGAQPAIAGSNDGFVARFDASLTRLLRVSYFGGSGPDRINGIAIHPSTGEVFVAGETSSLDLPKTDGGAQPLPAGDVEGFVARFDPTLAMQLQSTYVGGHGPDFLHALALDPRGGSVYVGGQTLSTDDFPATAGGANASPPGGNGNFDAFLTRLDPSLTRFLQSTFVGSAGSEDVLGIAVRPLNGDVYAVGWTDYLDFPATGGGAQAGAGGERDCYVARFGPELTTLMRATYLGGSGDDACYGIAIHPTRGDLFVTGDTFSTDLPATAGGAQSAYLGGADGFLARIDPELTRFFQVTYLGASGDDTPLALAVHPATGEVLVAGTTLSDDFPAVSGGAQATYAGGSIFGGDGFLARLPAGLEAASSGCVADPVTLCLSGGRFQVRAAWRVPSQGSSGVGAAVPLSGDTGYFWFFSSGNVELVLKVLDGRALNGAFWVFYGALSDAEYTITVTDTDTGTVRTYSNPAGMLASRADTSAFPDPAAAPSGAVAPSVGAAAADISAATPCAADGEVLCLGEARFLLEVDWAVPSQGRSGHARAVPLTGDTGYFWFFASTNVELVVKILDGRAVNGHFWVFYGALSDVQYTLTVRDTATQSVRTYSNASGNLASVADTSAF